MNKQKGEIGVLSQSRSTKVFAVALISIGIGAVVLKVLGNNPPPAGAFSLSEYYHLVPIEKVIFSNIARSSSIWDSIEISYSSTEPIGIDKQYSRSGPFNYDVLSYHFFVWNGSIGADGQIQSTEKWHKQLLITPDQTWHGGEQTIRIAVISNGKITYPTDFQRKKAEALAAALSRKFHIQSASIYYPGNWW